MTILPAMHHQYDIYTIQFNDFYHFVLNNQDNSVCPFSLYIIHVLSFTE